MDVHRWWPVISGHKRVKLSTSTGAKDGAGATLKACEASPPAQHMTRSGIAPSASTTPRYPPEMLQPRHWNDGAGLVLLRCREREAAPVQMSKAITSPALLPPASGLVDLFLFSPIFPPLHSSSLYPLHLSLIPSVCRCMFRG
jgi:hypothetical protein